MQRDPFRDFDRHREEFDRQFNRTWRMAKVAWAVYALVSLAFLAVVGWAIVKLVQHFT